jgi:predicted RecB family nuclease
MIRLIASEFITHYRPSLCDLRIFLKRKAGKEPELSAFDEVLRRLGRRHEWGHLTTLGGYTNLSGISPDERVTRTLEAITNRASVIYQPSFLVNDKIAGTDVEIVGNPDFLLLDGDGYLIRDSKMSRRIDEENHPEILLQVRLYGWLFEKSCGKCAKGLQVHSGTNEIVNIVYDGGVSALSALARILVIKQLEHEPYEPVGWTKCLGCDFNGPCWAKAESAADVALVLDIDQGLARTLHESGIGSRKELLDKFDATSLSKVKRLYATREQKVGKKAERIIRFAEAMEKKKKEFWPPLLSQPFQTM